MRTTISVHPTRFDTSDFTSTTAPFVTVEVFAGDDSRTSLFLTTPAQCDELITAAERAKLLLIRGGVAQ